MDAAARIGAEQARRAIVIGSVDTGKSTLCRFLLNEAQRAGRSSALLDCDVGQKTVGPPACVTLAEAGSTKLAFVGTTNPLRAGDASSRGCAASRRLPRWIS